MGTAYEKGIGSVVTGSGVTLERSPRVEITDAEKRYLTGLVAGTGEAGKAVVLDSSGDVTLPNDLAITGDIFGGEDLRLTLASDSAKNTMSFRRGRAGPAIVADNDTEGVIQFFAHDGVGYIHAGGIEALIDGTPGVDDVPTEIVIYTHDGTTLADRIRVTPAGHLEPYTDGTYNSGSATKKWLKVFTDAIALGATDITATGTEINKLDDSVEDVYADGIGLARIAKATYDFAVDGGAISAIDLGTTIPANSIIMGGLVDVQTTCTSSSDTGTGALSVEGANDIVAAVAIGTGTPWDQGLQAIIPAMTAGTAVKTTAAANITFTIAVEAFTAGKFTVILYYIPTIVNT